MSEECILQEFLELKSHMCINTIPWSVVIQGMVLMINNSNINMTRSW